MLALEPALQDQVVLWSEHTLSASLCRDVAQQVLVLPVDGVHHVIEVLPRGLCRAQFHYIGVFIILLLGAFSQLWVLLLDDSAEPI